MLPIAPFILNVIILCDSRGAFLSLILSTVVLVFFAPPRVRKRVLMLVCLGGVATWMLLGDPRIVERFMTTFAAKEDRDHSAQGRMDYWIAGMRMLGDHPFGTGGDGFKRVYGPQYIAAVSGESFRSRSVHNGYINEACNWGLQGIFLQMLFMMGGLAVLWRTARSYKTVGDPFSRLLGIVLFVGTVGFLGECMFGAFLDAEWGFWCIALAVSHVRVCGATAPVVSNPIPNYTPTGFAHSLG